MLNSYQMRNIWRRVCPGVEQCVLRVRETDQTSFVDYNLQHARQEPLARVDSSLAGNLVTDESAPWLIWQDDLDAVDAPVPKIGDEIRQTLPDTSEVVWEITNVNAELFGQPYVCTCLRRAVRS